MIRKHTPGQSNEDESRIGDALLAIHAGEVDDAQLQLMEAEAIERLKSHQITIQDAELISDFLDTQKSFIQRERKMAERRIRDELNPPQSRARKLARRVLRF